MITENLGLIETVLFFLDSLEADTVLTIVLFQTIICFKHFLFYTIIQALIRVLVLLTCF